MWAMPQWAMLVDIIAAWLGQRGIFVSYNECGALELWTWRCSNKKYIMAFWVRIAPTQPSKRCQGDEHGYSHGLSHMVQARTQSLWLVLPTRYLSGAQKTTLNGDFSFLFGTGSKLPVFNSPLEAPRIWLLRGQSPRNFSVSSPV